MIRARASAFSEWCATIFEHAEPAWREYRSAAWYVARLREEGFTVEEGSGGMPTAFCARWQSPAGDGPVIGFYAEYDAVPGNCQAARPERAPRDGLGFGAAGHTDPHSALGIGALAGALATKAAMTEHRIPGGIQITGEPAEKLRGSKPLHAAKGYYDGLTAMLSFHPFYMLPLCNTVRWDTQCGAAYAFVYRFRCDTPQVWGAIDGAPIPQSHSDIRAPGANDALLLMLQSGRTLRDSFLPHRGGWSVSEAILSAGQATADNLPAQATDLQYMLRMPDLAMAEAFSKRLDTLAEHAAAMSGCTVQKVWVSKSRPGITNHVMAEVVWRAFQAVGPPDWTEAARDQARAVQAACGLPVDTGDPLIAECVSLIDPREAEAVLRQDLPPAQINSTSDDYTDMTWHCPTARFYVARPALRGGPYPPWAMNALGGIPALIDPTVTTAARVLARSALELLCDPERRAAAWREFETRRAEAGALPPLADYDPPIALPWPEYVETVRGRHWHIPY
nr:amidohydrolase [Cognatishimia sp. F0-27]